MEPINEDQQMGYLLSKIEDIAKGQEVLTLKVTSLEERVNDKFKTAEVVVKVMKFLALALIAILTFKFGDVTRLWSYFFS